MQGTSVYRGVSWDKTNESWRVNIWRLNERTQTNIGRYSDEVEAALAFDAAAIALGRTDGLNFPEKLSKAQITDALLLKLFKTTDRDKVKEIVEEHQKQKALDLTDRQAQVDAQNHDYKFVRYLSGCNSIRLYRGQVHTTTKEQDELPESLRAGASKDNRQAFSTNTFETAEEAAKAVDRFSYKLGRHSFINFPLSEEERAELDSIGMEELIASFRQAGHKNKQGTSVYRGVSWNKSAERWTVNIVRLNVQTYIGRYTDEVKAALAYDAAAIALGRTDGLNFPETVSEAKITDALLLKLFKTSDRDKVEEIIEHQQQEKGSAMSKGWKALLNKKLNTLPKDPEITGGEVGRKRKKPAPRSSKKKADRRESSEEEAAEELPMHDDGNVDNVDYGVNDDSEEATRGGAVGRKRKKPAQRSSKKKADRRERSEEEAAEELPMHDDGNVDNVDYGVNDDNEEAIQGGGGTEDVQGQGLAAVSSHQDGPVPRKRRRRERRGEGEEDAEPIKEVHAGSSGPGGVGDPLLIGDQQQQLLYSGGLVAPTDLQGTALVKQEPDYLEQAVGAHPDLVFPTDASMFPTQSPALSSQELALVLPTSMDTHLGPSLLDTMAFESISGWIPLDGGESLTENVPHSQPPHLQPQHPQLPHAQQPHTGGLLALAGGQSALAVKQEPDYLEQACGAQPGLVFPTHASMFPTQSPALSSQEHALVLPSSMDPQLGPSLMDTTAFESISGWIPLDGGESLTENVPHSQPPQPLLPHAQLPDLALPHLQLPEAQLPEGVIKPDPDSGLL